MKIISKFKDYYDYLVGHYGFDEVIVYDRREYPVYAPKDYVKNEHYLFSICGEYVPVVKLNGEFIFDEKDDRLKDWSDKSFLKYKKGRESKENIRFRQPVILTIYGKTYIPKLSDFNIPSIIDADEMYQKIYAYLGWLKDNPEAPQILDNTQKILSHGFDKKKSFRPKMK